MIPSDPRVIFVAYVASLGVVVLLLLIVCILLTVIAWQQRTALRHLIRSGVRVALEPAPAAPVAPVAPVALEPAPAAPVAPVAPVALEPAPAAPVAPVAPWPLNLPQRPRWPRFSGQLMNSSGKRLVQRLPIFQPAL